MMHAYGMLGIAAALAPAGAPDAKETTESVTRRIVAAFDANESVTATYLVEQDYPRQSIKTSGSGTFAYAKQAGKRLFRLDFTNTTTQELNTGTMTNAQAVTYIDDGEFLYTVNSLPGRSYKNAIKQKSNPSRVESGGAYALDIVTERFDLTVQPEEMLDGAPCYVLEGLPKENATPRARKLRLYFRKADGIQAKKVQFNSKGIAYRTARLTDIKINEKIDPDRFKFVPPPGVKVTDLTNQPPRDAPLRDRYKRN